MLLKAPTSVHCRSRKFASDHLQIGNDRVFDISDVNGNLGLEGRKGAIEERDILIGGWLGVPSGKLFWHASRKTAVSGTIHVQLAHRIRALCAAQSSILESRYGHNYIFNLGEYDWSKLAREMIAKETYQARIESNARRLDETTSVRRYCCFDFDAFFIIFRNVAILCCSVHSPLTATLPFFWMLGWQSKVSHLSTARS